MANRSAFSRFANLPFTNRQNLSGVYAFPVNVVQIKSQVEQLIVELYPAIGIVIMLLIRMRLTANQRTHSKEDHEQANDSAFDS